MSTTVDSRVVEMRFDNQHFEKNVSTTMSTLDKLKKSLNLTGASKGLENINSSVKNVNMSGLGSAIETVQAKFSALGVVGVTALANITNSAVNAGKRIVSALTIDPIKTGFQEYETQINAVQTILANTQSKGTTITDVNSALDELNTYADKTIYNFTEMTRNIGTFTAAGVDLDKSVTSIKGIANLAAVSGSTSQQASTAMYQLSQALAAGKVQLMDWNSVVNAGMGGQVFQDALKRTATQMGYNVDEMIKKYGSFRESLTKGEWLTAEVLTETLTQLSGAYTEADLLAQGYTKEQAKEILELAKTAEDAATKVKTFTQLWDTLKEAAQSGWTQTWEIIVGDFEEAKSLLTNVSDVLNEMIGKSAEARNALLQGWKDEGGREMLIEALTNAFEGLMSIIKPVKEAFREIFPPLTVDQLVGFTEGLKNLTEKFKIGSTTADNLKRTFKGVFAIMDIGVQIVKNLFSGFGKLVGYILPAGEGFLGITAKIGDFLVKIDEAVKSSNIFGKIIEGIGNILKPVAEGIKTFAQSILDSFDNISGNAESRLEPLSALGEFIKNVFVALGNVVKDVAPWVTNLASGVGETIKSLLNAITSSVQNADYSKFFDIINGGVFTAIGVSIAKFVKSTGDVVDNASGFLENLSGILEGVGDAFDAFTKSLQAKTLMTIASAIAILAAALIALSLVDSEKLTTALAAITALFIELFGAIAIFGSIANGKNFGSIGKVSRAMIGISTSLLILGAALKIVSSLSWEELAIGLTGIVVGLGALVGAVNLLPDKKVNNAAKAIRKLSVALVIFSAAMKILGSMSWEELAIGLTGTVVGLGALVAAANLLPKDMALKSLGIISLATALVILGGALKIMGSMSWGEIARGLVAMGVALAEITVAMNFMPKNMAFTASGLLIVSTALVVLGKALNSMGAMSWGEIARGLVALGGSLAIVAVGVNAMRGAISGAASLLVVATAIAIFTPALQTLGSMSLAEIGKSLLALAGAFTVMGVAGLLLGSLTPTLLGLSAAMILFGVAVAAIGVGVLAFATGMTALAASGAAGALAITTIVSSLIGLIPYFIEQIGIGFIKLCEVISGSAAAICEAAKTVILALVDALVTCVPVIVEGVFVLIDSLLSTLVEYTPSIVSSLFDFLIGVMDALAEKIPDLIQSGVNLLMSFFTGVIDALKGIDPGVLVNGILAVGMISALMLSLAAMAALTPAAMVGVLGMGAVIAELAIVLAAIGALAQIPGLEWLISEGGLFLETIGTAIGQFVGGIVGGIAQGITSSLPDIGTDLSAFMQNIQPFIDGAKQIDTSVIEGVKALAGMILALTAANILEGLTSWLTGGSSLTKFGEELAAFGPCMKQYADAVSGLDASAIEASANAAKALSELAANLPNSGGLMGLLAGENDIASFGAQLVPFGTSLKLYSQAVSGVDAEAIARSAEAAKALADMTTHIPNEGGVVSWFTGENSISKFGSDLIALGTGLKGFAIATAGIAPESITAAAGAAKALAEMTAVIPTEGGIKAWFSGESSVSKFSADLISLGMGLKGFAIATTGIIPENITAAANAAKSLAEMTAIIPTEGGIKAWFSGEASISKFSSDLIMLGTGLKGFALATTGIVPESITAAAGAAKALAEMTNVIPTESGIKAWFSGESSVSKFSNDLVLLGMGLKGFAIATTGIVPESITAAAGAAKALAEMTNVIPTEGGIKAWFGGESSISKFSSDLIMLGTGLKGFAIATAGIIPESITAAAGAAKVLAEMTNVIPTEGGIKAWFGGEASISKFSNDLILLGVGLKGFALATTGIVPESITAAASAAKSLAEMTNVIPKEGGIKAWFSGESSIAKFADQLPTLGKGLTGFSESVSGIIPENITAAASAAKSLAEMTKSTPKNSDKIVEFGENLKIFGGKLKGYFSSVSGIAADSISSSKNAITAIKDVSTINTGSLSNIGKAIDDLVKSLKNLSSIDSSLVNQFKQTLSELGKVGAEEFLKPFKDIKTEMTSAAQAAVTAFVNGINSNQARVRTAGSQLVSACVSALKSGSSSFSSAGAYLVSGFASGISSNKSKAVSAAKEMAKAAADAAKKELKEKSPSKIGYEIGDFFGIAFVNGIRYYVEKAYNASSEMAASAKQGLSDAISRVRDVLDSDMDMQPVIRPVIDLSNVTSGTRAINNMLAMGSSIGVSTNIGAISAGMSRRNQNIGNDDIVSAIKNLGRKLDNVSGDIYNFDGITYDDGSNINNAVKTLVRAAKMERRV